MRHNAPWRRWIHCVVICLEFSHPEPADVAHVLRTIGAAGVENGTTFQQAEAALSVLEIACDLRKPANATERLDDGKNVDR